MRKYELAKILGTIASVGGATIIIFYKSTLILHQASQPVGSNLEEGSFFNTTKIQNWTWGCIFLLGHYLSWAGWMVLQALILKKYPAKLSLTSFTCFFGLTQFLFIAAFVERDPKYWKIYSAEEICTILDATWCIQKGGPIFIACFQPVQTVLVAGMAFAILGDQLYSRRHYKPTDNRLHSFLSFLKKNGVNLDEVEIQKANDDYKSYESRKPAKDQFATDVSSILVSIQPDIPNK
ncbi:unnamed protein product [Fraxinus pennsylvanica]|uniref:Uncharacterized protein n=1 Tax=Fraxinus pennsylvanica TaxID=56036 RepID=A0AAD2ACQ6_9LAMI|nr:unnamed protein product [Fraxinus pennsylvanica]